MVVSPRERLRMSQGETLLVTGGAGYIGSHTLVELLAAGHAVLVLDNFSNSCAAVLDRVAELSGREVPWVEGDVRDTSLLQKVFAEQEQRGTPITAVLHFAALKAVGESVAEPLRYYDNNVAGTLSLLSVMQQFKVLRFVFSSSATVYGEPTALPYVEDHQIAPTNPYGHSKAMVEQLLRDLCQAREQFTAITLRYFNPIGAHPSGLLGEDPHDVPNNLFPFITKVAVGQLPALQIFGNDYETPDGTGVRDYIHVVDLAQGHLAALDYGRKQSGFHAFNLGTGRGTSVLELVAAFERVTGAAVPRQWAARRPGDIAAAWADPSLAREVLSWQARHTIDDMCADGWRWQSQHPDGYRTASPSAPVRGDPAT